MDKIFRLVSLLFQLIFPVSRYTIKGRYMATRKNKAEIAKETFYPGKGSVMPS